MEIVGHEEIRRKLTNLVKEKKVGHAYLFYGKEGIGKKLVAQEFAKNMMCLQPVEGVSCGKCESCQQFGNNADFQMITPENNIIKVDTIRAFEEEVFLKPTNSERKCFIIDDSEWMNESSQNALLKVLEEPPEYVSIILISSHKEKLLYTILSRVTEIDFKPLNEIQMKRIVSDKQAVYIPYAGGSVEKLLKLASDDYIQLAENLLDVFLTKDFLAINRKINEIKKDKTLKDNMNQILETLVIVCYQRLRMNVDVYRNFIQIIEKTNNNLQKNANLELALDNMMTQICY